MIRERNAIAKSLSICDCVRPQWDVDVLLNNGACKIRIDTEIGRRIYGEQAANLPHYDDKAKGAAAIMPASPLFMICAEKKSGGTPVM